MYEEEDNVKLLGTRALPESNRRVKKHRRGAELHPLSDSEMGDKDEDDNFEETTVFSDSLYGDSLPSMRAQLAATQMQSRRKRKSSLEKRALESSIDSKHTSTTILENSTKKETEFSNHGEYNSLGGTILPPKKRKKKESVMKS